MQNTIELKIEESLNIAAPSWPLQNTVAVNPFWFLKNKRFDVALKIVSSACHNSFLIPIKYYREKIASGAISEERLNPSIRECLREFKGTGSGMPNGLAELIEKIEGEKPIAQSTETLSEFLEADLGCNSQVISEMGKYCAAYFDNRQAISGFPWGRVPFWEGWLEAITLDQSMEVFGLEEFRRSILQLSALNSRDAIAAMLERMKCLSDPVQIAYMRRLVASVLGWTTQFKYHEWQFGLGHISENHVRAQDLLAVRMAYDFGLYCTLEKDSPLEISKWKSSFEISPAEEKRQDQLFQLHSLFQLASEMDYQEKIVSAIGSNGIPNARHVQGAKDVVDVKTQLVFCIDVRSEMLRYYIEQEDDRIQTIGFAGFFGVPFDYKLLGETQPSHRLPVLLKPAFKVTEGSLPEKPTALDHRLILGKLYAYFRNLRKNPLSSFVYVELFGGLYIEKMIRKTFLVLSEKGIEKFRSGRIPHRFDPRGSGPSQIDVVEASGASLSLEHKIERAEAGLRHMGLTGPFAPLVFIVGHGSATTNNAFGSSLDCGACGGHAGDINARFIADLLNDSEVRRGIALKGIEIPASTWFVACVHETVTDKIFVLEPHKIPGELEKSLEEVICTLEVASNKTREDRLFSRSDVLDTSANRRSKNWSEVRPEWGLAGNACFIVAPRKRTRGLKLRSRSFLHDYDWRKDQAQGYKTLELIMTAPMVVTNWINLHYYASTVAPTVFGAGNKVLHNLTGESGVVEGNGGDLRVGLPIQSVHDGRQFVHEPLRLSVFIEAPQEEIEKIIEKHEVVRHLVENEWLHLLQIDPENLEISRRKGLGNYVTVKN